MSDLVLMHQQQGIAELMARAHARFLDCKDLTPEEAERLGEAIATIARDVQFYAGDLARYAEARWPDLHHQCWPEWVSPGMLARTAGVCRAYPKEDDRQHECTYSQYLMVAGKPDRQRLLAEELIGKTTDESRAAQQGARPSTDSKPVTEGVQAAPRWLLAIDVNYHLTRTWSSGAGMEAAKTVADWLARTVERLKAKGLTDCVCCFDSPTSFRKVLTDGWDAPYKPRATKDPEHTSQLIIVEDLLRKHGFCCLKLDDFEADDLLASYARQFDGKVTMMTCDKDMRQSLSSKCNMLTDVEWNDDETSGELMPVYKWVSAKDHIAGCTYNGVRVEGITPDKWTEFQAIAGDPTDGVSGIPGIGAKGAADLLKEFGTVEAVIAAAKAGAASITPKKREAIVAFEPKLEVTRKLVTLRDDLTVPNSTRI